MRLSKNNRTGAASRRRGFTLVEVIVVMLVIALAAAFAFPSYRNTLIKSRRAEAKALLFQLMQQQERYFSQTNTYIAFSAGATSADAKKFKWFSGETAANSAYEIEGRACEGEDIQSCIKLLAMPGTGRVNSNFEDRDCGVLTLTSTGFKSADGSATQCW